MGSVGADGAGLGSLGTSLLTASGGLSTLLLRVAALLWVPVTLAINAVATLNLGNHFVHGFDASIADLPTLYDQYRHYVGFVFEPVQTWVTNTLHFQLPAWMGDAAVIYGATASGLALGSMSFAARQQFVEQAQGSAASIGWPLAIIGLLLRSVQTRFVTGFARAHTILFSLYVAASFGAAYALNTFSHQVAALLQ